MDASPSGDSERLAALELRFFDDWIAAEPEEATALGLAEPEGRLSVPSMAAGEEEGSRARAALEELDAIERETALDRDGKLRAWAIRALAAERGRAEESLEAVPYAVMMLAHAAARATTATERAVVARRAHALPAYVASAREALEAGVRRGRPFSTAVVATVAAQLESAPSDLQEIVMTAFESAPSASVTLRGVCRTPRDLAALDLEGATALCPASRKHSVHGPNPAHRDRIARREADWGPCVFAHLAGDGVGIAHYKGHENEHIAMNGMSLGPETPLRPAGKVPIEGDSRALEPTRIGRGLRSERGDRDGRCGGARSGARRRRAGRHGQRDNSNRAGLRARRS